MGQRKRYRPSRNSLSGPGDEVARRDFETLFEIERADLVCDGLDQLGAHAEQIAALLSQPRTPEAGEPGTEQPASEQPAGGAPSSTETSGKSKSAAQDDLLEAQKAFSRLENLLVDGRLPSAEARRHVSPPGAPRRPAAAEVRELIASIYHGISPERAAKQRGTRTAESAATAAGPTVAVQEPQVEPAAPPRGTIGPLINDVVDDVESFLRNRQGAATGGDAESSDETDLHVTRCRRSGPGPAGPGGENRGGGGGGNPGRGGGASRAGGPLCEPYVDFLGPDLVGLALSGGGIRSATFNLGLLQGLNSFQVLDHIDYLSTVSGGGYIGGWWSAWRMRNAVPGAVFPARLTPEAPIVRHLREFSKFLAPRAGLFSVELWYGLVAIVGGLLPTLVIAALQFVACVFGWILLTAFLLHGAVVSHFTQPAASWPYWRHLFRYPGLCEIAAMLYVTIMVQGVCEGVTARRQRQLAAGQLPYAGALFFGLGSIGAIVAALLLPPIHQALSHAAGPAPLSPTAPWDQFVAYISHPIIHRAEIHWELLAPAVAWLGAALIILVLRSLLIRPLSYFFPEPRDPAFHAGGSRAISRFLVLALIWAVFALLWEVALILVGRYRVALVGVGGGALVGAELFRQIRNWISFRPNEAQTGKMLDQIRPFVPQILAYGVLVCVFILTAAGVSVFLPKTHSFFSVAGGFALTIVAIVSVAALIDPHAFGLHDFYRGRIARAYLGASNPSPRVGLDNRVTLEDVDDDFPIEHLAQASVRRPIHLVCCAANDLGGDMLEGLGRGSRSATLSRFGAMIANHSQEIPDLPFGAALTASAAAFNSQMGSLSIEYGPAVSFLLTTLNLRLGRWIEHPAGRPDTTPLSSAARLPGLLILKEFWSHSNAGVDQHGFALDRFVHLSDGGHFENLSLYELVRRHCRYIIVSDCGADPEFAFDDLGNALRRIREDFGIEIEIDVSPLKPVTPGGAATQHVAVGTIHYDEQFDKGILIFFKPTLTGDEPDDVEQYKTRNQAFPQETTTDQFYDEAQWESYRRLGEHSARSALRFLESNSRRGGSRYRVFTEAYWQWYPTPAGLADKMLNYTARYSNFLDNLRQSGCDTLTRELFAELQMAGPTTAPAPVTTGPAVAATPPGPPRHDLHRVVPLLLEMGQILEDTFIGLGFSSNWNNPLNTGWMSLFHRWTQAPTFRAIWPVIQSLYSREFRLFLNDRFRMDRFSPGDLNSATLSQWIKTPAARTPPDGAALLTWLDRGRPDPFHPNPTTGAAPLVFSLELPIAIPNFIQVEFQIAIARVAIDGGIAKWSSDEIFVVPWLRGVNIAIVLVEEILRHLASLNIGRVEVEFDGSRGAAGTPTRTDEAARAYRADLVRLYKSVGFKLRRSRVDGRQFLIREL